MNLALNQDLGLFILRLAVAAVFVYHSLPKLKTPAKMSQGMGWPAWKVVLLGAVELGSSISLLTGFHFRWGAALLALVMLGAIYHKIFKWKMKFSMSGAVGWEFDLILLAANAAIFFVGAGAWRLF
ncbi:MAG: DoxX family protein [Candidatus Yanofskybacteria bacterium]|nr:DoxX family protein [Candidatus Yanofskybacteria bacterium]